MLRQALYTDFVIGSVMELVQELRSADLMHEPLEPAAVIYDLLNKIGIPVDGIRMILGADMAQIDDRQQALPCCLCDQPAEGVIKVNGGYRLVCEEHGAVALRQGHELVSAELA